MKMVVKLNTNAGKCVLLKQVPVGAGLKTHRLSESFHSQ
eukprot:COSAG06_NODE_55722_length_288_cov_0.825397_1_plen_38_part_10